MRLFHNAERRREARAVGTALALGLAACIGLVSCQPDAAKAQSARQALCRLYPEMAEALTAFGEAPAFRGLDGRGLVAEIWIGASGSWSLIYVDTTRTACLAAEGQAGDRIAAPVEEQRG